MTFQPALHPLLLVLLCAPLLVLAIVAFVRAGTAGAHAMWALRVILVLACFVLALRPGIPGGRSETLATEVDIVLVVDTTASIVAEDWDGDGADGPRPRLDGIRGDVSAIIAAYPGARFALITFDASAQLRMPLTSDTTALASAMAVLRPEVTAQSRGSSIGIAADLLEETLRTAAEGSPDRARMVFYLGDGEQTVSSSPESFASSAALLSGGAVLGYGTAKGGPMRITTVGADDPASGYIEYQGAPAISVIDEAALQTIADQLGVGLQLRSADAAIVLPEAPTTAVADGRATGDVLEIGWAIAILIVLLLAVEAARATALVVRMRVTTRPPRGGRA